MKDLGEAGTCSVLSRVGWLWLLRCQEVIFWLSALRLSPYPPGYPILGGE